MTAVEETAASTGGKCTHGVGSGRLPVGDATRPVLPQDPYASAVRAALAALRFVPDAMETGIRREPEGGWELFLRLEWLPSHDDLVPLALYIDGLTVEWSHLAGWLVRAQDVTAPEVDEIADPQVVADIAVHAALHGVTCRCEKPGRELRWEKAAELEAALEAFGAGRAGVAG